MPMAFDGFRHWRGEAGEDGILDLVLDRADANANTLSAGVMEKLDRVLDLVAAGPWKGLVLRSGKAGGFIAGADVSEFGGLTETEEATARIRRGQGVFAKLEALPLPTVALVHGFCLGGGLELALAMKRAAELFRRKLKDPRRVAAALDRLSGDLAGAGAARADVVIEAIVEDAGARRALYRTLEPRMRPEALLATNTSSIPLEELAGALEHPERFVGLHFFNPVASMQLVEVVSMASTPAAVSERALAFVGAIRRLPLPVRSTPGFLVNRILMPYLMEAVALEGEGVPAHEIDRAALAFGMPMGPVLLADTVGLDVCLSVARILGASFGCAVPRRLEELVAAGRLGRKTGRGFYDYRGNRPRIPKAPLPTPGGPVEQRLILCLLNEAVACHRERVTPDADLLDAGMIFGTGFAPFTGGPMNHNRNEGAEVQRARLEGLEHRIGGRFAPDPGWRSLSD